MPSWLCCDRHANSTRTHARTKPVGVQTNEREASCVQTRRDPSRAACSLMIIIMYLWIRCLRVCVSIACLAVLLSLLAAQHIVYNANKHIIYWRSSAIHIDAIYHRYLFFLAPHTAQSIPIGRNVLVIYSTSSGRERRPIRPNNVPSSTPSSSSSTHHTYREL